MPGYKRYNFKKALSAFVWILFAMGAAALLVAAVRKKDNDHCTAVDISIQGVKNNFFIDKADVTHMLEKMNLGKLKTRPVNTFNLAGMEAVLEKNEWIKSAELFFDNNNVLKINIIEREPVVRIFDTSGTSFYIDSSLQKLPLSNKFSARLPVFTDFPGSLNFSSKADSALLADIKNIGTYILQDSFWMAQIDQVDITPERTFEMIPKIGNHVIIFGNAENYTEKFNNLLVFYKDVQSKIGWNKYSKINVSYKDQVVAVKRGVGEIKSDSLRTIQLIKLLVANAQKQANDTINNIQLVQPKEEMFIPLSQPHDETFIDEQPLFNDTIVSKQVRANPLEHAPAALKPILKSGDVSGQINNPKPNIKVNPAEKANSINTKKSLSKPILKQSPGNITKDAKAVMPPKNEY